MAPRGYSARRCLLALAGLFASGLALQVTPDSPCAPLCIDDKDGDKSDTGASTTTGKDITCDDKDYTSKPAGQKFKKCMTCLEDSGYSKGNETDQQWFFYNMRYSIDHCIFGYNSTEVESNPCQTSTACGAVEGVLMTGDLDPAKTANYAYCDASDGTSLVSDEFNNCLACIKAGGDHRYLTNYLIALEAACRQKPAPGQTVSLNDTVFAATQIHRVDATPASVAGDGLLLPPTTIAAISVSGLVAVLLATGCVYMQYRKRRNRRNPRHQRRHRHRTVSSLSFRCRAGLSSSLGHRFSSTGQQYAGAAGAAGQDPSRGAAEGGGGVTAGNEKAAASIRFQTVQDEYEFDEKRELQERDRVEKEEQQQQLQQARLDAETMHVGQYHQRDAERKATEAALEKPWKEQSYQLQLQQKQQQQQQQKQPQHQKLPGFYQQHEPRQKTQQQPLRIHPTRMPPAPLPPPPPPPASSTSSHSPTSARPNLWNPHNAMQSFETLARSPSASSRASSTTRTAASARAAAAVASHYRSKETLASIKTSLPTAPALAVTSATSILSSRFSPQEPDHNNNNINNHNGYYASPTSASSATPLLPSSFGPRIKPYNPAEFGGSMVSLGPVSTTTSSGVSGGTDLIAPSPISSSGDGTPTSVLIPMGVERRFYSAGSPTVVNVVGAAAVGAPEPSPSINQVAAAASGWPLPARPAASAAGPTTAAAAASAASYYYGEQNTSPASAEREYYRYPGRRAPAVAAGPGGTPVETGTVQTVFPAPPMKPTKPSRKW